MSIECYNDRCMFHATNSTDEEGPFCYEENCRTDSLVCPSCDSCDIITKKVTETICFDGATVLCYCQNCELDWYNDLILQDDEK
jgi:hypothetical protein